MTKHHRVSGDVDPAVQEAMTNASRAGFETAMTRVPYGATGELQRGLHEPEVQPDGNVEWGSSAPHTLPVEYGSRPHWVPDGEPFERLKLWARVVLGDEDAAEAVRWNIFNHGTNPQPFIRPGVERMRAVLRGTGVATYLRERIP